MQGTSTAAPVSTHLPEGISRPKLSPLAGMRVTFYTVKRRHESHRSSGKVDHRLVRPCDQEMVMDREVDEDRFCSLPGVASEHLPNLLFLIGETRGSVSVTRGELACFVVCGMAAWWHLTHPSGRVSGKSRSIRIQPIRPVRMADS